MTMEIHARSVKVLPLLYERCDLPPFLRGKLYADFTDDSAFDDALAKVLRRLEKQGFHREEIFVMTPNK